MFKKLIFGIFCLVLGFALGIGLNCSYGAMKGFKTPEQRQEYIAKHQKGLTLEKLEKRITKLEQEVKQLKKGK